MILHEIWNPFLAVAWLVLTLFGCWSLADGDDLLLAPTAVAASLTVQLHLSYVAPAASALVWGLVGLAVTIVRARREAASGAGEGSAPGTAPRLRRNVLLAATASLACWIGPIVDEVVHRPGNLELLVRAALHAHDPGAGIAGGVRDLTRGIGLHPLWLRSFDGLIVPQLVVTWGASVGAVVVLAVLVGLTVQAVRADRSTQVALLGTSWAALAGGFFSAASASGAEGLQVLADVHIVWIPIGMFAWMALACVLADRVAERVGFRVGTPRLAALGAVVVAVVLVLVAWPRLGAKMNYGSVAFGPVRRFGPAIVRSLPERDGPWRVAGEGELATTLVLPGVLFYLMADGVRVSFPDLNVPEVGPEQRAQPDEVLAGTILVVSGDDAGAPRPGYRLVSTWDPAHVPARYRDFNRTTLPIKQVKQAVYLRVGPAAAGGSGTAPQAP